ncbi:hypothetical protein [Alteraurantiacibacter palmitatis]|uniref:DUF2946 domain-containing protein n=1 Tax=Alteraurantiacibacter palmitatis TaxID=2054628 RepID=A0ABV7E291_9SPHN
MATRKKGQATTLLGPRRGPKNGWAFWLMGALLVLGLAAWQWGAPIRAQAEVATAYGARTACSCRHLGGRDLASCKGDFVPGMEAVFLSEDDEARTVTARVPLVARATAQYRDGFGCVLEGWEN